MTGFPQASLVMVLVSVGGCWANAADGWAGAGAAAGLAAVAPFTGWTEVAAPVVGSIAFFPPFSLRSPLGAGDSSRVVATESLTMIRRASLLSLRTMNIHCVYRPACQMKAFVDPEEV